MSGLPYWTTDIGGFLGGDPDDPAYQEIYVRWFQYGTFCPIFRTHGARKANELWSYGPRAQEILTRYDNLRYRLLPYIYSKRVEGDIRRLHADARASDGFSFRPKRSGPPRSVHVRAGTTGEPGDPSRSNFAQRLPARRCELV